MRRVWIAVLTTWALIAIVAMLAWTHAPLASSPQVGGQTIVVQGPGGAAHVVHATTQTSAVALR
jgi:hypothetical protein